MHRHAFLTGLLLCAGCLIPRHADAAAPLTFRFDHHIFAVTATDITSWKRPVDAWMLDGQVIIPPQAFLVDGDVLPSLPTGVARTTTTTWDPAAIRATIDRRIASVFDREPGSVTISKNEDDEIIFEGLGLPGRSIDTETTITLAIAALERGIPEVILPVEETPAVVTVDDSGLRTLGIREVVTVGESNFAGSPVNRRHNIGVGLSKFNGHLIEQGETFSFGKVLGPVNASTGYREELVIKGDRTEPDFGGGLCQVSTTAYRGVWEYGFPIDQRINHSYAVSYYGPQGTDATVYPPNPDMKFTNDSPGALLIQTHREGNDAYFIYYGTRDERESQVVGPFIWGSRPAPPDRIVYTTELPPGTKKKLGERHPGLSAAWFRITLQDGEETIEPVYSIYEARPLYEEVGVLELPAESGSGTTTGIITQDELEAPLTQ